MLQDRDPTTPIPTTNAGAPSLTPQLGPGWETTKANLSLPLHLFLLFFLSFPEGIC